MRRPDWIVLAPGTLKRLEPAILRVSGDDPEDGCPWELAEGKGYVAIIEHEPGSKGGRDDDLAKALSKTAKKPVYVLWIDDDEGPSRVYAWEAGKSRGEVKAGVSDTLVTLGFKLPWMSRGKKVALRVEAPMVKAKAGEAMVSHWSVSQWQQMMRKGGDWYMLLDGASATSIDQILALCDDPDAEVRFLPATMLRHVGYYGLTMEKRLKPGLAALEKLATDRSKKVSALAIETREGFIERGEYEGARREFPWLLNYDEKYLAKALALFDEDRQIVHRYL